MKTSLKVGFFLFIIGALGTIVIIRYKPGIPEDLGVLALGTGIFGLYVIVCTLLGHNQKKG